MDDSGLIIYNCLFWLVTMHVGIKVAPYGRRPVVCAQKEPMAAKYCFSARCSIRPNRLVDGAIGIIFGYDKRPTVSRDVESVAEIFCREAGYVPGDVELLLHTECPVEVNNEIFVTLFKEPTHGDIGVATMNAIAIEQQFHVSKPSLYQHKSTRDTDDADDSDNDDKDDPPGGGGGNSPRPPDGPGGPGGPPDEGGGGNGSLPRVPVTPSSPGGVALALP